MSAQPNPFVEEILLRWGIQDFLENEALYRKPENVECLVSLTKALIKRSAELEKANDENIEALNELKTSIRSLV